MKYPCLLYALLMITIDIWMVSKISSFTEITFNIIQSKVNFFEMKYDSIMSSSITDELIQNFKFE